MSLHICALLAKGASVVLDFPGNTTQQRAWFRMLFEQSDVAHELHFIDVPDDLCNVNSKIAASTFRWVAREQQAPNSMQSRHSSKRLLPKSVSMSFVVTAHEVE